MTDHGNPPRRTQGGTPSRGAPTIIFIPVFDQIRELPGVLAEIEECQFQDVEFLLVNNGSSDGSEDLVSQSPHSYLDIPENRGIGYSYMLALSWALRRDYEIFGAMAANGKMLPSEIPRLVEPIRSGHADYVSGSRFLEGGSYPNLPLFRRATIPFVNLIAYMTTRSRLTDATNGFRAFRLDWIPRAAFDWHAEWLWTYGFEYYLYAKFLRTRKIACIEVPATMRYPESGSYSKIRPGVDWWAMIKPWLLATRGKGFD